MTLAKYEESGELPQASADSATCCVQHVGSQSVSPDGIFCAYC